MSKCPNCGYCPHCGRKDAVPNPWPYTQPNQTPRWHPGLSPNQTQKPTWINPYVNYC